MSDLLSQVVIILKDTTHPGNIGAAARAMKTMGLPHLRLVGARTLIDGTSRAMAAGATDILTAAESYATLAEAVADCTHVFAFTARRRQRAAPTLLPDEMGAEAARLCEQGGRVALLFGGERCGLENEDIQQAHYTVEIPTSVSYHSLNLSQAVQIAAYEMRRASAAKTNPNHAADAREYPTRAELDAMMKHWQEALSSIGLPKTKENHLLLPRLQLLLTRAQLDRSEVKLLRGICREILRRHSDKG